MSSVLVRRLRQTNGEQMVRDVLERAGVPYEASFLDDPANWIWYEEACALLDYLREWETSTDEATRLKAWEKILETNADQVFSIGTVNGIKQPIVVGPKVKNVPKEGYYAWDPGGYIGLYKPDTFWMSQ